MKPHFPELNKSDFLINGPAGHIEVRTAWPAQTLQPYVAVICHPQPLKLGTMHNKVVTTLHQAHNKLGIPTVRFNFRGVGKSTGQHDYGKGEQEDLKAVINWVNQTLPNHALLLSGFSFGSFISASVANTQPVEALISVAPATDRQDFVSLTDIQSPWLLVASKQDEVVPYETFISTSEQLTPAHETRLFENASHFFHGQLIDLRETLMQWLQTALPLS